MRDRGRQREDSHSARNTRAGSEVSEMRGDVSKTR